MSHIYPSTRRAVEDWRPIIARALSQAAHCTLIGRREHGSAPSQSASPGKGIGATQSTGGVRFPSLHFAHLARLPGVRLISLQMGDGTEQLAELAGRFPVAELSQGNDGDEPRGDFLDTAAVISQVDLVVAPESAVAHIWPGAWVAGSGFPCRPSAIGAGCWNARIALGIRPCGCSDRRSPATGIPSFSEWPKRSRRCFRKSPWRAAGHRRYYADFVEHVADVIVMDGFGAAMPAALGASKSRGFAKATSEGVRPWLVKRS